MKARPRVVIIQAHIPHYRVSFYERLREKCEGLGVCIEVVYSPECSIAAVPSDLAWGFKVKGRRLGPAIVQFLPSRAWNADLVIIPQEVKFISNIVVFLWRKITRQKIAIWGHGRDFQSPDNDSLRSRLRKFISRRADWWFAYNLMCVEVVRELGFDEAKITKVRNSIDIEKIREVKKDVTDEQLVILKKSLAIQSENVAVFSGRFNEVKRTEFLLKACVLIREQVPDFHMILIGSGPKQKLVDKMTAQHDWLHAVGAKDDHENVPYWMIAKLLLMPGAVGLVVLDSFVFGVPMAVISGVRHGPEITYYKPDVHGIEVELNTVQAYADTVVAVMMDPVKLDYLSANCLDESRNFSLTKMVDNYTRGVLQCLND